MTFKDYENEAMKTRQAHVIGVSDPVIPLLGLAGEAGELLSEYRKWLRDGPAHEMSKEKLLEELGDLLWYLADAASTFGLSLDDVADANLSKIRDRWNLTSDSRTVFFDDDFPETERLPRNFNVEFTSYNEADRRCVGMTISGTQVGTPLTDNSYNVDGYRFHDVFHLACVASLGWSPVMRSLLKRKRKSNPIVDEVEDGGRAVVIEEGICALIFSYALKHNMLDGITSIDYELLRTIRGMTVGLEVSSYSTRVWEEMIINCYSIWRQVELALEGTINVDMVRKSLTLA